MKRRMLCLLLVLLSVCLLSGSVYAASAEPAYVRDEAGLLNPNQIQRLEQMAASVSKQYGVGVYMVTVGDYRSLHSDGAYEAAFTYYRGSGLGEGAEKNGLLLLLSMEERDYALFCFGDKAQYAFTDYGMEKLEKVFLDNFGQDDWNGGFEDYVRECASYLAKAEAGKPVKGSPAGLIALFIILSLVIAAIVCGVLVGQMKSVRKQTTASEYTVGGLVLTEQYDLFTHRTESRRKIERAESSNSSQAKTGGGGSGRSGKF